MDKPAENRALLARVASLFGRLEELALAAAMITLALLVVGNVLSRALFGASVAPAEELAQFTVILITFIGLAYAARTGRHIRMTAFYDILPQRARKALMMAICGLTALLLLLLATRALEYVLVVRTLGTVSPALQIPLWIIYLAAPAGFFIGALHYLLALLRNALTSGIWLSWDVPDAYADATPQDGI